MIRGTVRSGDVELAYSVEGSGPDTVLLVMGLGGRSADWGRKFPAVLSSRYRVVRFDNRCTGASTVVPAGFTLDDMASDAVAVLDALGVERAHVIGISMGGMISQLLALNHPGKVDRLVLIATHFGGDSVVPPRNEALRLFDPAEFRALGKDPVAMARFTMSVITAKGFAERHPEAVEELVEYVRAQPTRPSGFMGQLQAIVLSNRADRVRDIAHPTLVVHGTEDALIPLDNGRALSERILGARLSVIEDCGHMPMFEKPEELSRIVLEFLAEPRGVAQAETSGLAAPRRVGPAT